MAQEKTIEELTKEFLALNVNEHTEVKKVDRDTALTYLSWAWAWTETLKKDPTATYNIVKTVGADGVAHCYEYSADLGYMVHTTVTIKGLTREMWLPVMDGKNNAMKNTEWSYKVKKYQYGKWDGQSYETKSVASATMTDINKAIMRCLVKNLAMFGLGTYIYAGEDLPVEAGEPCTPEQVAKMKDLGVLEENIKRRYKVEDLSGLSFSQAEFIITTKKKQLEKE